MPSTPSKSGPSYLPGQKDFGGSLFAPGGYFQQLLGGGPNVGLERQAARGAEGLTNNLAQQGLTGSGLAAKSMTDYQSKVTGQRQDNLTEILLNAMRPGSSVSTGGTPSKFGGLFGI